MEARYLGVKSEIRSGISVVQHANVSVDLEYGLDASVVVVFVALSLVTITTNAIFIYVICRNKALQTATNFILFSLALSDLLVGALVTPLNFINFLGKFYVNEIMCVFLNGCIVCVPLVSLFHLLAVACERYLAIIHPFYHRRFVKHRVIAMIILLCWLLPVILGGVPAVVWNRLEERSHWKEAYRICSFLVIFPCKYIMLFISSLFTVYALELILYARIFCVALSQARRLTHERSMRGSTLTLHSTAQDSAPKDQSRARGEFRVVVVLLVTVGYFLLSYSPASVLCILLCADQPTDPLVWRLLLLLAFTNSTVNPIIYGLGNRPIRQAFLKSFTKNNEEARLPNYV